MLVLNFVAFLPFSAALVISTAPNSKVSRHTLPNLGYRKLMLRSGALMQAAQLRAIVGIPDHKGGGYRAIVRMAERRVEFKGGSP